MLLKAREVVKYVSRKCINCLSLIDISKQYLLEKQHRDALTAAAYFYNYTPHTDVVFGLLQKDIN